MTDYSIEPVQTATEAQRCFALMAELRPHLASAQEFAERWHRQAQFGYQLLALYEADAFLHAPAKAPVALAGYRVQENLVHGRYLYVDDLVSASSQRSQGHGERLMQHLQDEVQRNGCAKLVLDTPLSNALGHRFYFRCGLLATSLRFSWTLPKACP